MNMLDRSIACQIYILGDKGEYIKRLYVYCIYNDR